jgi:hypothetical protein
VRVPGSVSHRVDDVVDAYADAEVGEAERVTWLVEPLPGVAEVGVLGDCDHDVALVVVDASPAGDSAIFFVASAEVFGSGDLVAVVEIEDGVKDGVVVGDVDDGTVGEDHLHGLFEVGLLFGSVEIVCHEEAAAKEIVAEFFCLGFGEAPLAYLNGVEPRPVVDFVAVIEVDGLLDGAGVDAGEAADGSGECAVGFGVVLGPEGEAFAPVALEARVVAVEGAGRIHESREGPFGGSLPVGRERHGFVSFDGRVLAKGALCVEHAEHNSDEGNRATRSRKDRHAHYSPRSDLRLTVRRRDALYGDLKLWFGFCRLHVEDGG